MFTSAQNRHSWLGVGLVVGSAALYVLTFGLLYPVLGSTTNLLVLLPAAIAGWFFGLRSSLLAGLLTLPLNLILQGSVEPLDWAGVVRQIVGLGLLEPVL